MAAKGLASAVEAPKLSPEVLDRYVGTYAAADTPDAKAKITREGGTLFFQPPGAPGAMPLEATAENKFEIPPPSPSNSTPPKAR